jgi:hypothetical protein
MALSPGQSSETLKVSGGLKSASAGCCVGSNSSGRTDGPLTSAEFRNPQGTGKWGSEECQCRLLRVVAVQVRLMVSLPVQSSETLKVSGGLKSASAGCCVESNSPCRTDGLLTSAEFRNPQDEWRSEECQCRLLWVVVILVGLMASSPVQSSETLKVSGGLKSQCRLWWEAVMALSPGLLSSEILKVSVVRRGLDGQIASYGGQAVEGTRPK